MNSNKSALVISLDFELVWGLFDHIDIKDKTTYFDNTLKVLPKIIDAFVKNDINATWATVGMLFNENWEEWEQNIPLIKPNYTNTILDAYSYGKAHKKSGLDRFFFAPDVIRDLQQATGQEIGSHTYSHYYCLEAGQTKSQFEADMDSAIKLAKNFNISLQSLVFPRNQFNDDYLQSCAERGILSVRSNPDVWYWDTKSASNLSSKLFRTADAYMNLGSKSYHFDSLNSTQISCQPASRFLRPQNRYELLNSLALTRIKNEIIAAARNGEVYHLWWHPHNFGVNPEKAITSLKAIIEVYKHCQSTYGMESLTMNEVQKRTSYAKND